MLGQLTKGKLKKVKSILEKDGRAAYFRIETIPEEHISVVFKEDKKVAHKFESIKALEEFVENNGNKRENKGSSTTVKRESILRRAASTAKRIAEKVVGGKDSKGE